MAGAPHRLLYGKVGIHRPYFETPHGDVSYGQVQEAYDKMRDRLRDYLRRVNVSDRLADDMMTVPPENVRFLSPMELAAYGLGFVDPVTKETSDLMEAQKLGITRVEYMQRRSRSETICAYVDPNNRRVLSRQCVDAVLAGKPIERAPPCRSGAKVCDPWERDWNGKKIGAGDRVSNDGFVIPAGE